MDFVDLCQQKLKIPLSPIMIRGRVQLRHSPKFSMLDFDSASIPDSHVDIDAGRSGSSVSSFDQQMLKVQAVNGTFFPHT